MVRIRGRTQVRHRIAGKNPHFAGPPVAGEQVIVADSPDPDVTEIPETELVGSSHFQRCHVLVLALLVTPVIAARVSDTVRPDLAWAHVRRPRVSAYSRMGDVQH